MNGTSAGRGMEQFRLFSVSCIPGCNKSAVRPELRGCEGGFNNALFGIGDEKMGGGGGLKRWSKLFIPIKPRDAAEKLGAEN